jgi:SAM-dependent methyltransferase
MSVFMKRIERPACSSEGFQLRHWEDAWQGWTMETIEAAVRWEGILPLARAAFPPGARLLEAGCGTGKYCIALDRLGYRMTGIDFAQSGLAVMRRLAPHLRGLLGSVLDLPFPDAQFDGALSLGVVEHFEEGPEKAIAELARVIAPGGRLLLTVPLHNQLHRWFPDHGARPADGGASAFYQYLYTRDEMRGLLEQAGFRVDRVRYLAKQLGLSELTSSARAWWHGGDARHEERAGTTGGAARASLSQDPGWLTRVKRAIKQAAPDVAYKLRALQLEAVEGLLPGPVCAHTIAFTCTRA